VCNILSGKTNNERGVGNIPFYDSNGQIAVVNTHLFEGDFVITARVLSIGSFHLVSGKFWAGDNTLNICVKPDTLLSIKFLYYWLKLNSEKFQYIKSGIIPKIRKSDVIEIQMPLPPLDFQQAVLVRLDALQSQLASLETLSKQAEDNARFILESYLGTA
jgi:type I restriction enzyme S subunit